MVLPSALKKPTMTKTEAIKAIKCHIPKIKDGKAQAEIHRALETLEKL